MLNSIESKLRLARFRVSESKRRLAQIETMIQEFTKMKNNLNGQIDYEEKKAGIYDVDHFAYPSFAKAARLRRNDLAGQIKNLQTQSTSVEKQLGELNQDLKKVQSKHDSEVTSRS